MQEPEILEIIKWDDKYLTGVEIIDSQHKNIFNFVNMLYTACENMEKREEVLKKIQQLDFYTTEHFDTEENYMEKLKYPDYSAHKEAHKCFKATYEEIRHGYIYKKADAVHVLALHLNQTMADWLDYHLQNEDQKFAEFLKGKL